MSHTQSSLEKLELSKIGSYLTTNWLGRGANELWTTIDSTNDRAMELAGSGAANGTIVIAEEQTAGRGRSGRVWFSPAGCGLYISFLLRPKIQIASLPVITLVTGVAVAQAIQKTLAMRPGLKWVNDLIVDGKKIAGILAEYSAGASRNVGARLTEPFLEQNPSEECRGGLHPPAPALIIGIGLNLNTPPNKLPADIEHKIGFLQSYLSSDQPMIDRHQLIASIANELELAIEQMQSGNLPSLLDQWRAYSITLGEEITAQVGDKQIIGQALDITDTGELIVKTNSGNITLSAGEVSIRRTTGSYI